MGLLKKWSTMVLKELLVREMSAERSAKSLICAAFRELNGTSGMQPIRNACAIGSLHSDPLPRLCIHRSAPRHLLPSELFLNQ